MSNMTAIILVMLLLGMLPYLIGGEESKLSKNLTVNVEPSILDFWIARLILNILGYATFFVPGALIVRYLKNIKYNESAGPGCLSNAIVLCIFGKESEKSSSEEGTSNPVDQEPSSFSYVLNLCFCFAGLQGSYLTWGVLQERIMKHEYGKTATEQGEFFTNSQFLVFVNRILALCIALTVIFVRPQPRHTAPLYKYSYSSISNIMSSWFQYEALKYVSFPTQVLAKASKVIPVMLMGKVVSKKTFEYYEYFTAAMISVGVSLFLLTSGDDKKVHSNVTTISGVILLVGYMLFDSFTSNWQGELFSKHKMSSIQMMAGVNLFSCLLTSISLIEQGGFFSASAFMLRHSDFVFHAVILSICSATGQLFIFHTIASFGAVTFIIIMTMRQGFAILLSCVIYGHPVTFVGVCGILIVFAALYLRIYANQKKRAQKQRLQASASTSKV
ncbi:adenosine 3'-phospho 5'-phosphosulfate transporter 1 isoform X2 [Patella vulgata]|uniref:adenosine 3'-phospho 5'-phosphosulfate transporter 1 isoform X2 n=1 Tax=Patella vulgata TaxID=6465 RepID=UPI0024A7FC10|nr:adenosine 3'-phospho 5'-phosphosulfate transporter 1 isoform X2 [Patella vulgata]